MLSASTLVLTEYSVCNRIYSEVKKSLFVAVRKHLPNQDSLERPVVVMRLPLHDVHPGSRHAADRPVPVVSNPHVEVPRVEVFKILIQGHKVLPKMVKCHEFNWITLENFYNFPFHAVKNILQERLRMRGQLYWIGWQGKHSQRHQFSMLKTTLKL